MPCALILMSIPSIKSSHVHRPCSNYNEGHSIDVVLPEHMKQLELLSARADTVVNRVWKN